MDDSEELFLQEFVVLCVSSGLDLQVKTVRGGWMSQLKKKLMKLRLKKKFFLSIAWVLLLYLLIRRQGQIIIIFGY